MTAPGSPSDAAPPPGDAPLSGGPLPGGPLPHRAAGGDAAGGDGAFDDGIPVPAAAIAGPTVERGIEWCADVLALPEWEPISDRLTALVTSPPAVPEGAADLPAHALGAWFAVDARAVRHLGPAWREAVAGRGARVERQVLTGGLHATLTVLTEEALAARLEAVSRAGLETRWTVQHATAAHDPMHRHAQIVGAARRLPPEGMERACRTQYLAATTAFRALLRGGVGAVALGEATAAVCRLACLLDWGCHPPAEWLEETARSSALGGRLRAWLEDVPSALAGDARAARWVVDAGSGVLREAEAALHTEYGATDWLRDPDSFAARPPR